MSGDDPEPLPDVPAAEGDDPEPTGPLAQVASFVTVFEAEALKSQLAGAGIAATLRDQHVVGVDPFMSNAIGGVKVLVAERDLERARELATDKSASANSIVFRVDRTARGAYTFMGGAGGMLAGVGVDVLLQTGLTASVTLTTVGLIWGLVRGGKVEGQCSSCSRLLAPELTSCSSCGGRVVGVLESANERLDAEERYRASQPKTPS